MIVEPFNKQVSRAESVTNNESQEILQGMYSVVTDSNGNSTINPFDKRISF
jgi:hypothetical protein